MVFGGFVFFKEPPGSSLLDKIPQTETTVMLISGSFLLIDIFRDKIVYFGQKASRGRGGQRVNVHVNNLILQTLHFQPVGFKT